MYKYLALILALCWSASITRAEDSVPTIRILPEDVVQDSIKQVRVATNHVAVLWTYTEAGAKKMVAFWKAHDGQDAITRIGSFEYRGGIAPRSSYPPGWGTYEGWLKTRTDKFYDVDEEDAKKIVAGLKKK